MDLSQDSWLNVSPDEGRQHTPWHEDDETQATGADTARLLGSARTRDTLVDDAQDVLRLGEAEGHDEYGEEDDELFLGLDEDLPAGEILSRIEHAVAQLVEDISAPRPPTLQLVSRTNRTAVPGNDAQEAPASSSSRLQTRSLLSSQGAGAFAFARVFLVLEVVHELLRHARKATQRDIYYKLISPPIITNQADVNSAIQDAVALLRVPRSSLGICCAPRGAVSGKLHIRDGPMSPWQDCSTAGMAGRSIPGCPDQIEALGLRCSARYLLVIEKDAIFQTLTQDRIFDTLPCVLVTAKGMPDLATRVFCAKLKACFPALTVLGLVDWNPSGVSILKTYKYGGGNLDSSRFVLPSLAWLGLRSSMLPGVEESQLQPLARRDHSLISSLQSSLAPLGEDGWCEELRFMGQRGIKAEIECLYSRSGGMAGLCDTIVQAILRREYI